MLRVRVARVDGAASVATAGIAAITSATATTMPRTRRLPLKLTCLLLSVHYLHCLVPSHCRAGNGARSAWRFWWVPPQHRALGGSGEGVRGNEGTDGCHNPPRGPLRLTIPILPGWNPPFASPETTAICAARCATGWRSTRVRN